MTRMEATKRGGSGGGTWGPGENSPPGSPRPHPPDYLHKHPVGTRISDPSEGPFQVRNRCCSEVGLRLSPHARAARISPGCGALVGVEQPHGGVGAIAPRSTWQLRELRGDRQPATATTPGTAGEHRFQKTHHGWRLI